MSSVIVIDSSEVKAMTMAAVMMMGTKQNQICNDDGLDE